MKKQRPSVNAHRKVSTDSNVIKPTKRIDQRVPKHIAKGSDGHSAFTDIDSDISGSDPMGAQRNEEFVSIGQELKDRLLTRRNFVIGAAGVAAIAATAFGMDIYNKAAEQAELSAVKEVAGDAAGASTSSGDLAILNVPDDGVFTTEACEYIEDASSVLRLQVNAKLPYGTLIFANNDDIAACLLPTETSDPISQIGLLSLQNGNLAKVLSSPVGMEEGFQICDVRSSANGMIWVESNIRSGVWRVYTTSVNGLTIGNPIKVAEGSNDWEIPTIAICDDKVFWQLVPNPTKLENVPKASLKSFLLTISIASISDTAAFENGSMTLSDMISEMQTDENSESPSDTSTFAIDSAKALEQAQIAYMSKGRMACAPTNSPVGIAFAPRSAESGTYYQLTHIDADSLEVTDQLTLPSAMVPTEVAYGETGFSFSFDSIYSYGGGISNLGTYTPAQPITLDTAEATENAIAAIEEGKRSNDGSTPELSQEEVLTAEKRGIAAVTDLYSVAEWFRFPRTPLASPSWCGNLFIIKSTNVVAVVDTEGRRYFTLSADGNGESYGEFLASSGTTNRIVTYANLDYTPLSGDPIKECAVRVWSV